MDGDATPTAEQQQPAANKSPSQMSLQEILASGKFFSQIFYREFWPPMNSLLGSFG